MRLEACDLPADEGAVVPLGNVMAPRADKGISPELALVDPGLGEDARSSLPHSDDTLARLELLVRAHRIAASREQKVLGTQASAGTPAAPRSAPEPGRRATGHRRASVLAGGTAAAALAAALLVGVRVDLQGNPAGVESTSIVEPPVAVTHPEDTTPSVPKTPVVPRTKPSRSRYAQPTTSGAPRRFVWAPVAGASGYRVEFFRGPTLVFSADTAPPWISIPESWTFAGSRQSLTPGDYRWYVWTVSSGRRSSQAVVQAKLVVPAR
jgi:hypothetical protein